MFQIVKNLDFIWKIITVLWATGSYLIGNQKTTDGAKHFAMAVFLLIGVIIWCIIDILSRRAVNKKIKEIDSYDYKMFFDFKSDPGVFSNMITTLFPKEIADEINTDNTCKNTASMTRAVWVNDENKDDLYAKTESLLKKELSGIQCKRITNEEKKGKCIVECIFVPLDKNDNTLLINRLDYYHPFLHQENMNRRKKPFSKKIEFSLISFSPLPDAFSQEYDPKDIYSKEVSSSANQPPKFDFQGVILRKMKKTSQEDLPVYYLMIVYTAKYDVVSFKTGNSVSTGKLDLKDIRKNTDWDVVKRFFTYSQFDSIPKPNCLTKLRNKIESIFFNVRTMDTLFFEKDHDEICGGVDWEELNSFCNLPSERMMIKEAEKEIIRRFYAKTSSKVEEKEEKKEQ